MPEIGNDVPDSNISNMITGDNNENNELRKGQVLWLRGIARLQTQVHFFII